MPKRGYIGADLMKVLAAKIRSDQSDNAPLEVVCDILNRS